MKVATLVLAVVLLSSQANGQLNLGGLNLSGLDLGGTLNGVLGTVTGLVSQILQLVVSLLHGLLGSIPKPVPGIPMTPQPDSPIALLDTGIRVLIADAVEEINLPTDAPSRIEEAVRDCLHHRTNPSEEIIARVTVILRGVFAARARIVDRVTATVSANLKSVAVSLADQLSKLIQVLRGLGDPSLDATINSLVVFNSAMAGVFGATATAASSINATALTQEALDSVRAIVEKAVAGLTADNVAEVAANLTRQLVALLDPKQTLLALAGLLQTVISTLTRLNNTLTQLLAVVLNIPQIRNALAG